MKGVPYVMIVDFFWYAKAPRKISAIFSIKNLRDSFFIVYFAVQSSF